MKPAALTALLSCGFVLWAGATMAAEEAQEPVPAEVIGENINLVKTLCADEMLETDPVFGGMNVLRVQEARDAEGHEIEGMAGKLLHYLPIAAASNLLSGPENLGRIVTVKGILYREALVIAVTGFQSAEEAADAGSEDDWDFEETPVTSPSQQQII